MGDNSNILFNKSLREIIQIKCYQPGQSVSSMLYVAYWNETFSCVTVIIWHQWKKMGDNSNILFNKTRCEGDNLYKMLPK